MCESSFAALIYMLPGLIFIVYFFMFLTKFNTQLELMDLSDAERDRIKKDVFKLKNWLKPSKPMFYFVLGDILLLVGLVLYVVECL